MDIDWVYLSVQNPGVRLLILENLANWGVRELVPQNSPNSRGARVSFQNFAPAAS